MHIPRVRLQQFFRTLALLCSAILLHSGQTSAQQTPVVFQPTSPSPAVGPLASHAGASGLGVVQRIEAFPEVIRPDLSELTFIFERGAGPELIVVQRAHAESRGLQGATWRGSFWTGDGTRGEAVLTRQGDLVVGTLWVGREIYEVHPLRNGEHILTQIDPDDDPGCGVDPLADPNAEKIAGEKPEGPQALPAAVTDQIQEEVTLDVLVLYSATAAADEGAGALEARIQHAVDLGNTVLANSQIPGRLRLVHTEQAPFAEAGTAATDLLNLASSAGVSDLRTQHQADLVGLVVENSDAGGIARVLREVGANGDRSQAFFTVRRQRLGGHLTFIHEIGHNLGAEHDPANAVCPDEASRPYSFGHFVDGEFRTVMAYPRLLSTPNACNCSGASCQACTLDCPRQPYFSNPRLDLHGQPLGVFAQQDNHRTLSQTLPLAVHYAAANDDFAARQEVHCFRGRARGSTYEATAENGEPAHATKVARSSVWWSWTSPAAGTVTLDTTGSECSGARLAVYRGSTLASLNEVRSDNGSGPDGNSVVQFPAQEGETYQIAVDCTPGPISVGWNLDPLSSGPPCIATASARNATETGVFLEGLVQPNGSEATLSFEYGMSSSYGSKTSDLVIGPGGGAFSRSALGLQCGTEYHYRAVADFLGGQVTGENRTFTTRSCSIEAKAPVQDDIFELGETVQVSWVSSLANGAAVQVDLVQGPNTIPSLIRDLGTLGAGVGSLSWTVPLDLTTGEDYRIRIADSGREEIFDLSGFFSIVDPLALTVTAPAAGDVLSTGETTTIRWDASPAVGPRVGVELWRGNIFTTELNASTDNDGSWQWIISQNQPSGNDYRVRVFDLNDDTASDLSGFFTILGSPEIEERSLTVTLLGEGAGRVTSTPAGIDCGTVCTAPFQRDQTVSLTAQPEAGSFFLGWSGNCFGPGTCDVSMSQERQVGAIFELESPLTLLASLPTDGETGILVHTTVRFTFDRKIVPGPAFDQILLLNSIGTPVPTRLTVSADKPYLFVDPLDRLEEGESYTVQAPAGAVQGIDGTTQLTPIEIGFTAQAPGALRLLASAHPFQVTEGDNIRFSVWFDRRLSNSRTLTFSSSDPSAIPAPSNLIIAAGDIATETQLLTQQVTSDRTVTLTAQADTGETASVTLEVKNTDGSRIGNLAFVQGTLQNDDDGDGILEAGELVEYLVQVENQGSATIFDVSLKVFVVDSIRLQTFGTGECTVGALGGFKTGQCDIRLLAHEKTPADRYTLKIQGLGSSSSFTAFDDVTVESEILPDFQVVTDLGQFQASPGQLIQQEFFVQNLADGFSEDLPSLSVFLQEEGGTPVPLFETLADVRGDLRTDQLFEYAYPAPSTPGTYQVWGEINPGQPIPEVSTGNNQTETFNLTVADPNLPPALDPIGDRAVNAGSLLTFTATAFDPNPSDSFTFGLVGAPAGATIDLFTGVFTWIPTLDQSPADFPVTVRVQDSGTPLLFDEEQIVIHVTRTSDLSVRYSSSLTRVQPGEAVEYMVEVSNAGPNPVEGVTVTVPFSAELKQITWTCSETAGTGSTCATSGTGAVFEQVSLASSGQVTFSVEATVSQVAEGLLVTTAAVATPPGVLDPISSNDTAVSSIPVVLGCLTDEVTVTDLSVSALEEIVACRSITTGIGVTIESGGTLTLKAGERVVLGNGFSVRDGGSVAIVIDEELQMP